jgi:TatD DNase family protein
MQLIDSHTHLYLPEFDNDRDEMINRAVACGVVKLLMPNIDFKSTGPLISAAKKYKGICYPMIGLHPTAVKDDYLIQLDKLEAITVQYKFIAVGEVGIDLYWDKTFIKEQKEAFKRQVAFAVRNRMPVIIHARNSFLEVFSVLEEFSGKDLKGVFHAFSGNIGDAEKAVRMGFMIGIGGMVTYKNSTLPGIMHSIGIENIITETDSPYLTPVPFRGTRNESSYICIINKKIAEIFEKEEEAVASVTFQNSCRLFNIC